MLAWKRFHRRGVLLDKMEHGHVLCGRYCIGQ